MKPVKTTKKKAARILAKAILSKRMGYHVSPSKPIGGKYIYPNGNQCAIGHIIGVPAALDLEGIAPDGYLLVGDMLARGKLVVPVDEAKWFTSLQNAHDVATSAQSKARRTQFRAEFEAMVAEAL